MNQGEIMGAVGVVVSVATAIIGVLNHKRCRSKCCGRELSASVDVENSTPPQERPAPKLNLPPEIK